MLDRGVDLLSSRVKCLTDMHGTAALVVDALVLIAEYLWLRRAF